MGRSLVGICGLQALLAFSYTISLTLSFEELLGVGDLTRGRRQWDQGRLMLLHSGTALGALNRILCVVWRKVEILVDRITVFDNHGHLRCIDRSRALHLVNSCCLFAFMLHHLERLLDLQGLRSLALGDFLEEILLCIP